MAKDTEPRAMSTLSETLGDFALVALVLFVGCIVTPWLASLV